MLKEQFYVHKNKATLNFIGTILKKKLFQEQHNVVKVNSVDKKQLKEHFVNN